MDADEQRKHHNHFGEWHQNTGDKTIAATPTLLFAGDIMPDRIVSSRRAIDINYRDGQQISRQKQDDRGQQSSPTLLDTLIPAPAQRDMTARAATSGVRITCKVAAEADAEFFIGPTGWSLRVETVPKLLNVKVRQRQNTEDHQRNKSKQTYTGLQKA